jgi:hypothetical protein
MSISLIQSPDIFTPAYNQMMWVFNSTLVNQQSFRYVVSITDKNDNLVTKLKVAPEPVNGYGYCDISKIISDNVTWDLDVNDSIISASHSIFEYKVNVSEEYLYSWPFSDTTFVSGGTTRIQGSTTHQFATGSAINVIVDNADTPGQNYTFINGLHTVTAITSNSLVVDTAFVSTSLNPGNVYFSDRTKTLTTGPTYSGYYGFNGRETFGNFIGWTSSVYSIPQSPTSSTRDFLTDAPDDFYATPEQDIWLNFFKTPGDTVAVNLKVENSNGDIFYTSNVWTNTFDSRIGQVAVGPNNIILSGTTSGTGPLIKSDTTYYDVWLQSAASTQLTKKRRIYLDKRCKISDYEILFLDRKGSFLSYAFQLRSKETGTVERESYNQFLGNISTSGWSYDTTDAGQTIYSVNYDKELELNTNWMNDDMSIFFEQIYTSPVTLLKDTDGNYYQVIVQDNGFETHRQNNKILIKKSIKVKFANKEISNI